MNESRQRFSGTVYELSSSGRHTNLIDELDVPETALPEHLLRTDNGLPELSELDVARHFLTLAQSNFGVESGMYPLGSCTMKYNPKIAEKLARLESFCNTHPLQAAEQVQGNLQLMYELQQWLAEIGGFHAVSLQPSAGAHGELSALLMIRAWHSDKGQADRHRVLVPDSAHGTNPASTTMAGYEVVEIPTDSRGNVDLSALNTACDDRVAALMITNPNTLGLYDENLEAITDAVHQCGALVYGDGANMNALTGILQPAKTGIDLMHYNLHKTFATPHGGGGPGAGPLAATRELADYLPGPVVHLNSEAEVSEARTAVPPNSGSVTSACIRAENPSPTQIHAEYVLTQPQRSIGRLSHHYGNFAVFVRAHSYIRSLGGEGLKLNAMHAVLNANYLRVSLKDSFTVPFERNNMHEFVCEGQVGDTGVHAIDISKRLMDFGFHPPTNYFPLIVNEALMIEPTECESLETLDAFISAMLAIKEEAEVNPDCLHNAPLNTAVGRVDETYAARHLKLQEFDDPT